MNAKQLVEFAADLRLDVPGAKLALLVAVEGFESAEITRLRAEVDALKRTHDEAMKRSHEVTQEMARQFETEVEALRADVVSREAEIASALQIVRVYAARNPLHDYNGVMQDPHGAHAWLARNDAARAAQGERG
jgi:hypothetical protein